MLSMGIGFVYFRCILGYCQKQLGDNSMLSMGYEACCIMGVGFRYLSSELLSCCRENSSYTHTQ